MHRAILHGSIVCFLTLLTQIGGVAWLIALVTKHRLLTFASLYVALTIATMFVAPMFGRVPLNCRSEGAFKMQSPVYCVLNRNYVSPELRNVVQELADNVSNQFPGTITLALDGSFPFFLTVFRYCRTCPMMMGENWISPSIIATIQAICLAKLLRQSAISIL